MWAHLKEIVGEARDDWTVSLMLYLIVTGGAANLVALFFAVKWCTEHVRIV